MDQLRLGRVKHYRIQMAGLMLFADVFGFAFTGFAIYELNEYLHFFLFEISDLKYTIIVLLCLVLFMSSSLYPGVGINPANEIRQVVKFISTGFMLGFIFFITLIPGFTLNYLALIPTWGISLVFVLLFRWCVRILAVQYNSWGEPVVIIGRGQQIGRFTDYFNHRRRLGFVPVLIAADLSEVSTINSNIPVIDLGNLEALPDDHFLKDDIHTVLVDTSVYSSIFQSDTIHPLFRLFRQVIFISDASWLKGSSLHIHDYESIIGVEARQTSLSAANMVFKRGLDIIIATMAGILLLPLLLLLIVLIKLDSHGPAFYVQDRIGKGGNRIKIYKFRSMVMDADQLLATYIEQNQKLKMEWIDNHKLKNDPRLTRLGKFLRKFSLDELPQLVNIIKGDMSLVGPRPLPEYHHSILSAKVQNLRSNIRPGLTGMWQVSGRSNNGISELEIWDSYYVHNWSVWLDVYILLRTVWVVMSRDGAY